MRRNHIVTLQLLTPDHNWLTVMRLHADVNKSSGKEYLDAGAMQSQGTYVFDVPYCRTVAAICGDTQNYRLQYNGRTYNIVDYDDPLEQHRHIRLLGVSYSV